jgi:hypothetical protein
LPQLQPTSSSFGVLICTCCTDICTLS